jgi:hypothetical protein
MIGVVLVGGILIGLIAGWAIAAWRNARTDAPPLQQQFHFTAVGMRRADPQATAYSHWRPIAPAQHFPDSEPLTIGSSFFTSSSIEQ